LTLNRFSRYELRTTDVPGAHAFYGDVFGDIFWGGGLDTALLPAPALARGVPPYWLGHIGVEDVVQTMYRFFDAGATRLGPPPPDGRDNAGVVLADPYGAKLALTPGTVDRRDIRVAWHLLSTRDETRAIELYASILGWTALDHQDLGERGRHVTFTWDAAGAPVGSTSDIARQPHVHPQWLFFFRTPDLDAALTRVRELGGLTLPATRTPEGARVAACDDPQGGAFGLYEDAKAGTRRTSIT
jgi:predicted enzyme related to lactoylglutathione lyase